MFHMATRRTGPRLGTMGRRGLAEGSSWRKGVLRRESRRVGEVAGGVGGFGEGDEVVEGEEVGVFGGCWRGARCGIPCWRLRIPGRGRGEQKRKKRKKITLRRRGR